LINKQQEKVYVEYPEGLVYLDFTTDGNPGTTAQRFSSSLGNYHLYRGHDYPWDAYLQS
jgi:hypothetical protein